VKFPAMPNIVPLKKILFIIFSIVDVGIQAFANAVRIEKNSVRVLQNGEFQFFQGIANVFGEAGTNKKNFVPVIYLLPQFFYVDV